jgi:hypothetical protein
LALDSGKAANSCQKTGCQTELPQLPDASGITSRTLLPQLSADLLIPVVKKDVSYATIILVCQTIGVTRLNTGIYLNAIA